MDLQVLYAVGFLIAYMLVIVSMEILHRKWKVKAEYTRKIAHTLASTSSLLFLVAFESHWYVFALGVVFFIIFYIGRKYHIIRSFESVGRRTSGTYILPISIFIVFWLTQQLGNNIYFILPVLIVGISDPLAGFVGSTYKGRTRNIMIGSYRLDKTYLGSGAFFISAFLIALSVLYFTGVQDSSVVFLTFSIALVATLTELVSERGLDNITVPLLVIFVMYMFL